MGLNHLITHTLGLTKLPPYLPTFVCAFVGFTLVHLVLAPWACRRWFPQAYGGKSRRARNQWAIHVVSQLHALIIVPLALWVVLTEEPARGADHHARAFGWDGRAGYVHAVACGYFLWDSLDAVWNFEDAGFVGHGVACLMIYAMSFKPFVAYYGTRCLLWETSTFFLNIHWFMDKTGRTGTKAQLINGGFLLGSFFGVRLVFGGMVSYGFLQTLMQVRQDMSWAYICVYGVGNALLTSLNWFWFYKMISALRRRFSDDEKPKDHERRRLVDSAGNPADAEDQEDSDAEEGNARAQN